MLRKALMRRSEGRRSRLEELVIYIIRRNCFTTFPHTHQNYVYIKHVQKKKINDVTFLFEEIFALQNIPIQIVYENFFTWISSIIILLASCVGVEMCVNVTHSLPGECLLRRVCFKFFFLLNIILVKTLLDDWFAISITSHHTKKTRQMRRSKNKWNKFSPEFPIPLFSASKMKMMESPWSVTNFQNTT